jgi:N utilization substance protein B
MNSPSPDPSQQPRFPDQSSTQDNPKSGARSQSGLRREGREAAIQFLFQQDFHLGTGTAEELESTVTDPSSDADFWKLRNSREDFDENTPEPVRAPIAPKARAFAESLIRGVSSHRDELDELITKFSRNYRLSRLAAVDRNILRLAVYEILHNKEVPPVVAINEAIELAKQYGSEDSGRFVNGLLDRIRAESQRGPREASPRKTKV